MHRWVPVVVGLSLSISVGASASPPSSPPAERIRSEFDAICRSFVDGENPYFGRAILTTLERRLAEAEGDPVVEVALRTRLGGERIRLGQQLQAIADLEQALTLLEQGGGAGPEDSGAVRHQILRLLAVAHLQLAEDLNCIERHTAASCILPIAPQAVHTRPEHARRAGDLLLLYLEEEPDDVQMRWLLNLARMISGDHPAGVPAAFRLPEGALASEIAFPAWRDAAPALGVDAFDLSGGAIMDDFDGDGLLDLVSSSWDPCQPLKAFRNDGGGGFEDVAERWGLASQLGGLNIVHADYDGDGALDLLVLRGAWLGEAGRIRNSLLKNDLAGPSGRFLDVTAAAGIAYPAYPTQAAAWADFDADGDLDLYLGNEASGASTDPLTLQREAGTVYPSQLFRNNGNGTFTDVARAAGADNRRFAKGAAWGDYDDDGDPDLYVSNIGPNRLYRNNGDGSFTDVAEELGATEPRAASFPTWFFDFDNDADLDLFVGGFNAPVPAIAASYFGERIEGHGSILYRNDGGRFTDVSAEVGIARPQLVMGANYGDLDNDGWLDMYLGTGFPASEALMPNLMYRNDGGRRFQDVTFAGGFGHLQKGHGVAFGDLDNDGRQELFEQMGGAFPFDAYGNVLYTGPPNDHRWLVLRLEGKGANRFAVGARLEVRVVEAGRGRSIHLLAGSGGSFGGSSMQQEIGLGKAERIESIAVRWAGGGAVQTFREIEPDRFYRAVEGEPRLIPVDAPRISLGTSLAEAQAKDGHPGHRSSDDMP